MKQSTKIIFAGVFLIVLVVTCIVVLKLLPRGENNEILSPKNIVSIAEEDFSKISVQNAEDSYTILFNNGDITVEGYEGLALNTEITENLLAVCKQMYAYDTIEKNCEDLAKYGMTSPTATVQITDIDGNEYNVVIGALMPSTTAYYVMLEGENTIYAVKTDYLNAYFLTSLRYISKQITQLPETDTEFLIENLKVTKQGETIFSFEAFSDSEKELSNSIGLFKITSPFVAVGKDANIISYLNAICNLTASSVECVGVTDATLNEYNLTEPEYIISYDYAGEQTVIYVSTIEDGFCNLYVQGRDIIYTTLAQKIQLLSFDAFSYANTTQFNRDINEVTRIILDINGKDSVYLVEDKDSKFNVTLDGKQLDSDQYISFFELLITSRIPGLANKPANVSPTLSITFKYNDDFSTKNDTVSFYKISDREYYMEINGVGSFYVSSLYIDKIIECAGKFNAGEEFDISW